MPAPCGDCQPANPDPIVPKDPPADPKGPDQKKDRKTANDERKAKERAQDLAAVRATATLEYLRAQWAVEDFFEPFSCIVNGNGKSAVTYQTVKVMGATAMGALATGFAAPETIPALPGVVMGAGVAAATDASVDLARDCFGF